MHAQQPLGPPRQRGAGHVCERHCAQHLHPVHTLMPRAVGHLLIPSCDARGYWVSRVKKKNPDRTARQTQAGLRIR